jgi:hypothetical protein
MAPRRSRRPSARSGGSSFPASSLICHPDANRPTTDVPASICARLAIPSSSACHPDAGRTVTDVHASTCACNVIPSSLDFHPEPGRAGTGVHASTCARLATPSPLACHPDAGHAGTGVHASTCARLATPSSLVCHPDAGRAGTDIHASTAARGAIPSSPVCHPEAGHAVTFDRAGTCRPKDLYSPVRFRPPPAPTRARAVFRRGLRRQAWASVRDGCVRESIDPSACGVLCAPWVESVRPQDDNFSGGRRGWTDSKKDFGGVSKWGRLVRRDGRGAMVGERRGTRLDRRRRCDS